VSEGSTTPDLVELVQRFIEAGNAGDIDAALNFFASDIVWEGVTATLEGRAAIRGFFRDVLDTYDEWRMGAAEIHNLGSGVTFSVLRAASYLDLDQPRAAAERLAEERG
jgi:ketosteroid isomerase-like protein